MFAGFYFSVKDPNIQMGVVQTCDNTCDNTRKDSVQARRRFADEIDIAIVMLERLLQTVERATPR